MRPRSPFLVAGFLTATIVVCAAPVLAQTPLAPAPRLELFGGYSFLPETDPDIEAFSKDGHGFALSADFNTHRHFGWTVDFDTQWWTVEGHGDETFFRGEHRGHLSYLSGGGRFVRRARRLSAFGSATVDLQWSSTSPYEIQDARNPENRHDKGSSGRALGFGFGGGVDVRLTNRVGIRLTQINYSLGGFGEGPGRKLRIKTGLIIAFP